VLEHCGIITVITATILTTVFVAVYCCRWI